MSIIGKSDVKGQLPSRFRTQTHLCQPDATGFPDKEPAGADPEENGSTENPPNFPSANGQKSIAMVTPKSVQD